MAGRAAVHVALVGAATAGPDLRFSRLSQGFYWAFLGLYPRSDPGLVALFIISAIGERGREWRNRGPPAGRSGNGAEGSRACGGQ